MKVKNLLAAFTSSAAAYLVYRRTKRVLDGFAAWRYPRFVHEPVSPDALGVPVFTYHSVAPPDVPDSVTPEAFERHMRHLAENGYHTLDADTFYDYLINRAPIPPKSVVITFDDGRASLWTTAYPILKKYDLRAVSFLIPAVMIERGVRLTLNDGEIDPYADMGDTPAITWEEAALMHADGVIDFQSHTLDHTLIYTGPKIVDFVSPGAAFGYHGYQLPAGADTSPGAPIYQSKSRMDAARRFFDDPELRQACIDHAAGDEAFFARADWRDDLHRFAAAYRREHNLDERYESAEEQRDAIMHSLSESKRLVEAHLPGHIVRHLCYPWHRYSVLAMAMARAAGYVSAFIDINPQKPFPTWNNPYLVQKFLPSNEYGDDPYQITRIDAGDDMVLSLPGKARLGYAQRVTKKLFRIPQFLRKAMP